MKSYNIIRNDEYYLEKKEGNTIANKPGQPTKYNPDTMPEKAYKLCLLGFTNEQLALGLDVSVSSITNWMREHEEFLTAIKKGREEADHNVAKSLYQRALGYSHPSEEIKTINGQIIRVETIKHYPPDTTACIFWLKNRQRDKWKNVWRLEHTGDNGKPIDVKMELAKMDLSDFSDDELLLLDKLSSSVNGNGKNGNGGNEHP